jgi:hypothetical protein
MLQQAVNVSGTLSGIASSSAAYVAGLMTWDEYQGPGNAPPTPASDIKVAPPPSPPPGPPKEPRFGVNARLVQGLDGSTARQVAQWESTLGRVLERAEGDDCHPRVVDTGLSTSLSTSVLVFICAEVRTARARVSI